MSIKRSILAAVMAAVLTVAVAAVASAQWPTSCIDLNDIVEEHLGNTGNVGIYQSTFGDQAEQACQNDHRNDVRSTFAWVNNPNAVIDSAIKETHWGSRWEYIRSDKWEISGSSRVGIPRLEAGRLVVPEISPGESFAYDVDYENVRFNFNGKRNAFTGFTTYWMSDLTLYSDSKPFPVYELGCEQTANGWRLYATTFSGYDWVLGGNTIQFQYRVDDGPPRYETWSIDPGDLDPYAWTYNPDGIIQAAIHGNRIVTRFHFADSPTTPKVSEPVFPAPELNFLLEKCGRTYRAPLNLGWPETCVALNDIVETYLGNLGNVRIYQAAFEDEAEAACRNDHRADVQSVFAWAID